MSSACVDSVRKHTQMVQRQKDFNIVECLPRKNRKLRGVEGIVRSILKVSVVFLPLPMSLLASGVLVKPATHTLGQTSP